MQKSEISGSRWKVCHLLSVCIPNHHEGRGETHFHGQSTIRAGMSLTVAAVFLSENASVPCRWMKDASPPAAAYSRAWRPALLVGILKICDWGLSFNHGDEGDMDTHLAFCFESHEVLRSDPNPFC